jgi:hypothetical protein
MYWFIGGGFHPSPFELLAAMVASEVSPAPGVDGPSERRAEFPSHITGRFMPSFQIKNCSACRSQFLTADGELVGMLGNCVYNSGE